MAPHLSSVEGPENVATTGHRSYEREVSGVCAIECPIVTGSLDNDIFLSFAL